MQHLAIYNSSDPNSSASVAILKYKFPWLENIDIKGKSSKVITTAISKVDDKSCDGVFIVSATTAKGGSGKLSKDQMTDLSKKTKNKKSRFVEFHENGGVGRAANVFKDIFPKTEQPLIIQYIASENLSEANKDKRAQAKAYVKKYMAKPEDTYSTQSWMRLIDFYGVVPSRSIKEGARTAVQDMDFLMNVVLPQGKEILEK